MDAQSIKNGSFQFVFLSHSIIFSHLIAVFHWFVQLFAMKSDLMDEQTPVKEV
jgi:hypothetical protein